MLHVAHSEPVSMLGGIVWSDMGEIVVENDKFSKMSKSFSMKLFHFNFKKNIIAVLEVYFFCRRVIT